MMHVWAKVSDAQEACTSHRRAGCESGPFDQVWRLFYTDPVSTVGSIARTVGFLILVISVAPLSHKMDPTPHAVQPSGFWYVEH